MNARRRARRCRLFHEGSSRRPSSSAQASSFASSASTSSVGSFSAATSSAERARSISGSGRRIISWKCCRMSAGSVMTGSPKTGKQLEVRDGAAIRRALLTWYRRHRRRLPWRETPDPWRVWVSEVMLQQTQVSTALPYYQRFVARFPDARALARAKPAQVLEAWAGLGYYRRARHLHEAAAIVVREHAGRVPSEPRAFAALPGVGRYTLGAVLSMGFGRPLPVLDGNVARVLSRWTAAPLSVKRPTDAKRLWDLAERLVPRGAGAAPGDWNQSLMELGALVCTPRAPRCEACPVRRHCRAHALGIQHRLPPVAARRAPVRIRRAVALVRDGGRVLVARREGSLLAGLWEPPGVELASSEDPGARLARRLAELGVRARLRSLGRSVRHTITHRDIRVELWEGELAGAAPRNNESARWVAGDRANGVPLTALGARLLRGER